MRQGAYHRELFICVLIGLARKIVGAFVLDVVYRLKTQAVASINLYTLPFRPDTEDLQALLYLVSSG